MLEEIEFHRLSKLRLEVDEPEDMLVDPFVRSSLSHFLSWVALSVSRMDVYSPTTRPTIAFRPKRSVLFNLWTVSNTTPPLRMTPSSSK